VSDLPSEITKEQFLKLYAGVVADYPRLRKSAHELRRYFQTMRLLASACPGNATVLDVGAWPGTLSVCLKRAGWNVCAIDKASDRSSGGGHDFLAGKETPAATAADAFSSICSREGIRIENLDLERASLPLPAESVDAVILAEVIEHLWSNPLFALAEVNRVLKLDTGRLVLSTPNLTSLRNRLNFLRGQVDRVIEHPLVSFWKAERLGHLGHLRLYSPAELETLLSLMGFRCEVRFERLDFGEMEPGQNGGGESAPPGRLPLRRLLKSPVAYWDAGWATALQLLEKVHPPFRQQVYVIGTKVADADFSRNRAASLRQLIAENRCP
jgi:SAM-dependent methyltransferase